MSQIFFVTMVNCRLQIWIKDEDEALGSMCFVAFKNFAEEVVFVRPAIRKSIHFLWNFSLLQNEYFVRIFFDYIKFHMLSRFSRINDIIIKFSF